MAAGCGAGACCCCCCGERESRTPEELTILGETEEEDDEILPRKDYESLDYDRSINEPYLEVLESLDSKKGWRYEAVKWMVVFAIGVCTGMVGLFVDFFVRLFSRLKFHIVQNCIHLGFVISVASLIETVAGLNKRTLGIIFESWSEKPHWL